MGAPKLHVGMITSATYVSTTPRFAISTVKRLSVPPGKEAGSVATIITCDFLCVDLPLLKHSNLYIILMYATHMVYGAWHLLVYTIYLCLYIH